MRFLSMIRVDEKSGQKPSERLMKEMGVLMEEATREGWLVKTAGLRPTSEGKRMRWNRGKLSQTDGPFTETKEVIGGFAILNYASHAEAIEGARRVMQIHAEHGYAELEIELRQMMEDPACGAQVPPRPEAVKERK